MRPLPAQIVPGQPPTALAPMQDITFASFMRTVAHCGAPDYFWTAFYRVHETSRLDEAIRDCILENDTGRPIIAQLIGEDLDHLPRAVGEFKGLPIAGIDINFGCPAPKVYRKNVGGGLLRDPGKIDAILGRLRGATDGLLSVKMRYGFEDDRHFEEILNLIEKHGIDLVSLHARSVHQLYRGKPDYSYVARAASRLKCPVLANGDISSADKAAAVVASTGAFGVMIGRPAIRNPWIFRQCRDRFAGTPVFVPTLGDVRAYVDELWEVTGGNSLAERLHVPRMKKLLNFIGLGVDPGGGFLRAMRVTSTAAELFEVCDAHMLRNGLSSSPFATDAHPGLIARPNAEGPEPGCM
ncbi:MAG TPA: tRNA-dihydrouridine synthase family protein [Opitutales bacterium]|nr:tRNA-dihydrouridine synthase family protein [Opitutales bacterium]